MKKKFDPRTSILLIVLISTLSVLAINIYYLLIIFIITLVITFALKVKPITAIYRMRRLISVLVFIAIMQSLTMSGGITLIEVFELKILTSNGLNMALSFILRMGILVLAVLLSTIYDSNEMIVGLVKLKVPYELAFMAVIAIKFIPMFKQEFQDRLNAVALRGINIRKLGLHKKVKVYSYIIVPAVSGSIIKSRDIASSMETRAFRAYPYRTSVRQLEFKLVDYITIILSIFIFLLIIYTMYFRRLL